MKIGVFYGSTGGATRRIARRIAAELAPFVWLTSDIAEATVDDLLNSDALVCGTSSWGMGQLQADWEAMLAELRGVSLAGKQVALFGLGDSFEHSWSYLNGMAALWRGLRECGASFVGRWPTAGYKFDESDALVDERHFVGLALDEDNYPLDTDVRLYAWLAQVWGEWEQAAASRRCGAA